MAHGTPDWGVTAGAVTTFQLTDLGELAARLGSLDTFDRRGDLVWGDGFEFSLNKWEVTTDGLGAAVALSTARARNGRYSCLLTAGSDSARFAEIQHAHPVPVTSRLGFEGSFSLGSNLTTLDFTYHIYNGSTLRIWSIRYDDANDRLQYFNSAGVAVTIASALNLPIQQTNFHTLKLVVDYSTGEYVRLLLNNVTYDLSGIAGRSLASAVAAHQRVFVDLVGIVAQNNTVYVDDVILTQNEPA